ncbi:MAG: hypothetical protein KJ804_13315 [Proteobacteria bacterium]|nr:hypothetical protein [Pseudomonadota bacterium]
MEKTVVAEDILARPRQKSKKGQEVANGMILPLVPTIQTRGSIEAEVQGINALQVIGKEGSIPLVRNKGDIKKGGPPILHQNSKPFCAWTPER